MKDFLQSIVAWLMDQCNAKNFFFFLPVTKWTITGYNAAGHAIVLVTTGSNYIIHTEVGLRNIKLGLMQESTQ